MHFPKAALCTLPELRPLRIAQEATLNDLTIRLFRSDGFAVPCVYIEWFRLAANYRELERHNSSQNVLLHSVRSAAGYMRRKRGQLYSYIYRRLDNVDDARKG